MWAIVPFAMLVGLLVYVLVQGAPTTGFKGKR